MRGNSMHQTKSYKDRYRPLFFLSDKGVRRHVEYLINDQVATGDKRNSYISRVGARKIVFSNIHYFMGNPYTSSKNRIDLLKKIING